MRAIYYARRINHSVSQSFNFATQKKKFRSKNHFTTDERLWAAGSLWRVQPIYWLARFLSSTKFIAARTDWANECDTIKFNAWERLVWAKGWYRSPFLAHFRKAKIKINLIRWRDGRGAIYALVSIWQHITIIIGSCLRTPAIQYSTENAEIIAPFSSVSQLHLVKFVRQNWATDENFWLMEIELQHRRQKTKKSIDKIQYMVCHKMARRNRRELEEPSIRRDINIERDSQRFRCQTQNRGKCVFSTRFSLVALSLTPISGSQTNERRRKTKKE